MKRGKFIVIDSGEGAGKTTQIKRLKDLYGNLVVLTREPGGSPYAEEIRNIILKSENAGQADAKVMFSLYWAARADHLKNTIIPALEKGKIVVCDRFDSSTFAYQIVAQDGRELEKLYWETREIFLGDTKPDLYIYFDIDPKIGLSRKNGQGADERNHFEDRQIKFHDALRKGFKEFIKHVPHEIIDASQPIDVVWNNFKTVVEKEINK